MEAARDTVLAERRDLGALATSRGLAGVLDALVAAHMEETGGLEAGLVVLAIGGYGRGDLSPHSDADLLVVAQERSTPVREAGASLARQLWDCGIDVNLTVRTPADCLEAMRGDHTLASSFLDRRYVTGDHDLEVALVKEAVEPFLKDGHEAFVRAKKEEAVRRRAGFPEGPHSLEPDLKEGPGGMRDAHLLRWVALAGSAGGGDAPLPSASPELAAAYETVLRDRTELHLLCRRRIELLDLSTQRELIPLLDPEETLGHGDAVRRHVEAMRPLFQAMRTLSLACDALVGREEKFDGSLPSSLDELLESLGERRPSAPWLRVLARTGALEKLLPPWKRVVALPQADPYHAWTVDEHTLRAMTGLDKALEGQGHLGERLALEGQMLQPEDLRLLRLALLLHDVGKETGALGHGSHGAVLLRDIPGLLNLDEERSERFLRLVEEHTHLGAASALAVPSDNEAVEDIARRVGDREGLRLLLLLTAADIAGVGRGAWTAWRASQLVEFHDRVASRLEGWEQQDLRATLPAAVEPDHRAGAEEMLALAPPHYLVSVDVQQAALHVALRRARLAAGGRPFASFLEMSDGIRFDLVAEDRPHLFADLAGALALRGMAILSADAFTFGDGMALDTFRVDTTRERAADVLDDLLASAMGQRDVAASVKRLASRIPLVAPRFPDREVRCWRAGGNGTSAELRIQCPDRPGLLHDLSRALSVAGCDLRQVRVATLGPRALDAFHVSLDGRAPEPGEETDRLLAALEAAWDVDRGESLWG
jgi:[protein-PII] uridylyltransferase